MPQRMSFYTTSINSAGGGTGNNLSNGVPQWDVDFNGLLLGVRFDFHASAAAGTDTTLSEPFGLKRTLLTLTNFNTDTTYHPSLALSDGTGSARTAYDRYHVDSSNLQVAVAETGGALTGAVVVTVQILEDY